MESQIDCESSGQVCKPTEENLAKCCFVITVGSDGLIEISSHNSENVSKAPQDGIDSKVSTLSGEIMNQRFRIAVVKEDSYELQSKLVDDQKPKGLKANRVLPRFVKLCNKDLANRPSFVVLEDALARNRIKHDMEHPRPDESVSSHTRRKISQSQICFQTKELCASKNMGSIDNNTQKGNAIPPVRKLSLRTIHHKMPTLSNELTQLVPEIKKKPSNRLFSREQQQHQKHPEQTPQQHEQLREQTELKHHQQLKKIQQQLLKEKHLSQQQHQTQQQHEAQQQHQTQQQHEAQQQNQSQQKHQAQQQHEAQQQNHSQQQHEAQQQQQPLQQHQQQMPQQQLQQPFGTTFPYMPFGFLPMSQTGAPSGSPMMYPCQQFLSSAPSNISSCSCCSCSNCCSPRTPQVCQMPLSIGCSQVQDLGHASNCCMLKTENGANCPCNGYGSCCPLPNLRPHPSMGFGSHPNSIHQFSQHMIPSVMATSTSTLHNQQTNIPIAGGFYPGCLCQPLCSCNQCTHYRMQAHHHSCCHCPWLFNNQQMYQLQQQQQLLQQQQHQRACCPINLHQRHHNSSKGVKALKDSKKPTNREGVKQLFTKKPAEIPKLETKEQSEEKDNQLISKKSLKETTRSIGGAANGKSNFNSTYLYLARFGRTCLILRPTTTALMPRLLTKRITRYSSVIAWPTRDVKSNIDTN
ncbi:uncharacterized protein LOC123038076 [Drosophila rhopaloa]|uniref:Mediator of RNA polymerase II transcription subunit 26 n=1 Tax=Drosophila rhopaloa TaxID=1041015 RepID=A0ABM5JFB7_DRORH|nr:uncharacterized protein LOC123038076 [Drosophila rhopaloa]